MQTKITTTGILEVKTMAIKRNLFKQLTRISPMKLPMSTMPTTETQAFGTPIGWVNDDLGRLEGFITKMLDGTLAFIHYDNLVEAVQYFIRKDDMNIPYSKAHTQAIQEIQDMKKKLLQVFVS